MRAGVGRLAERAFNETVSRGPGSIKAKVLQNSASRYNNHLGYIRFANGSLVWAARIVSKQSDPSKPFERNRMRDILLRQQKERLLMPVAQGWFEAVHPNAVSCAALAVGLLSAVAVMFHAYWLGLGLWLLNRLLDGLDGVVARAHNKQSDLGGYLDLFLDYIVYLAVPVAFVVAVPTMANLWAGLALFASYYLNTMSWMGLSPLVEKHRRQPATRFTSLEMPTGLIEGTETVIFYALFYCLPDYSAHLFLLLAVLVCVTAAQRLWWAYRQLS
jgi:phosphatidylglycerophosphate synthase